jgi:hypothetical protein
MIDKYCDECGREITFERDGIYYYRNNKLHRDICNTCMCKIAKDAGAIIKETTWGSVGRPHGYHLRRD